MPKKLGKCCILRRKHYFVRQGIVMMLQNRYQRRRMYTRIALGKNRAMDVVSGETSGGSGQLIILYPLLFGLQLGQCWIGPHTGAMSSNLAWLGLHRQPPPWSC